MSLKRAHVSRNTLLYAVAVVMLVLSIVLAVSWVLLWLVFPQGFFASRVLWVGIHKWVGLALSISIAVHILLHAGWLRTMTDRYLRPPRG